MRVSDLADDLKVGSKDLIILLRKMGIPVPDAQHALDDAAVNSVRTRMERERRAGHKSAGEALAAAIADVQVAPRRRRRRRRVEVEEPAPEVVEVAEEAAPADAEAAEPTEAVEAEPVEPELAEVDAPAAEAEPVEAAEEAVPEVEAAAEAEPEIAVEEAPAEAAEEPAPEAEVAPAAEAAPEAPTEAAPPAPAAPPAEKPEPVRKRAMEGPARVIRRPSPAASAGPGGRVRIQAEGYTPDGRRKDRERKKGKKKDRVDRDAVQSNIQRVMAEIKTGGKKRKKGRAAREAAKEERALQEEQAREERVRESRTVRVNEFLTVAELAELMDVPSTDIVGSAFKNLGLMVTVNQRLDFDQIEMLLDEFGFKAVREEEYGAEVEVEEVPDAPEDLRPRPPVVTVMGHVDHGKTLLLDSIRKTNVVAGEAGGITQHIGAYHVELGDDRSVTFLDTPGHAAFTAMRARGAEVTDIVILIVAADDSVMPQTIEAISHAKNAGVPMVVAVNKIDLPAANAPRVKQELLQHEVTVEEFGGDVLCAEISAKTGQGIDDLMEKILLQAEILELSANPSRNAEGTVIEAQLDVGKGPVSTVLVQRGTMRVGDPFVCGLFDGRVRAMLDERGHAVEEAGPGIPVQILGASGVPQAGDTCVVMDADKAAEIAQNRQRLDREKQQRIRDRGIKLGDFSQLLAEGKVSTLPLIIKGDVDGSVQALSDALEQLGTEEVAVEIVHRGVGAVNESDVLLAETAGAVIVGFRVRPGPQARLMAERQEVDIHSYDVIYEAVEEIRSALEGMLSPEKKENVLGTAEVRQTFKVTKVGTIAGCYVTHGVIHRNGRARLVRDGSVVYEGEIDSLKRFKDDVKEVREGFECGIGIKNYNDVKVGDLIECFDVTEVARTLDS